MTDTPKDEPRALADRVEASEGPSNICVSHPTRLCDFHVYLGNGQLAIDPRRLAEAAGIGDGRTQLRFRLPSLSTIHAQGESA